MHSAVSTLRNILIRVVSIDLGRKIDSIKLVILSVAQKGHGLVYTR